DPRLNLEIEKKTADTVYSGYLDFQNLGFFCSELTYEEGLPPNKIYFNKYRLSRVTYSGKIEIVIQRDTYEPTGHIDACNMPRTELIELMQRITNENDGNDPLGGSDR